MMKVYCYKVSKVIRSGGKKEVVQVDRSQLNLALVGMFYSYVFVLHPCVKGLGFLKVKQSNGASW